MPWMTVSEYARHRRVSKAYISKIKSRGMLKGALVQKKNERYPRIDSKRADKILGEVQDPNYTKESPTGQVKAQAKKKGGNGQGKEPLEPTAPGSGDQSFIDARTWSERYKAADRKLAYEIKAGKWILKAEVRDQAFKAARLARDTFLNISPRIGAIVAGEKDEEKCVEIIHKEILEAINEYIRQLAMLGD
jgi:hypothetical protein